MTRGTDTRQRILRAAATLFRQQGYNGTGLNQILAHSSAPRGVLYFHYPGGKQQLASESITLAGRELSTRMVAALAGAPDGQTGIVRLGELFARILEDSEFREGCPVATVALEAAADSEPVRSACDTTYSVWLQGLTNYLRGHGVSEIQAGPLASMVLSALQGALLLARVQRDTAVVHTITQQLADLVGQATRS